MRRQAVFLCLVLMLTRGMQGQEDGGGELHNEDAITDSYNDIFTTNQVIKRQQSLEIFNESLNGTSEFEDKDSRNLDIFTTSIFASINITTFDQQELSQGTKMYEDSAPSLPEFLLEPQDAYVIKNVPAKLTCAVRSATEAHFKCNGEWLSRASATYEEHSNETTGEKYIQVTVEITRNTLETFFASFSYWCQCVAWSSAGQLKSRKAVVKLAYLRRNFEQEPTGGNVVIGNEFKLLCAPPVGQPLAAVEWLRNDVIVQSGPGSNYFVTQEGNLIVQAQKIEDSGNYTCVAKNLAGKRRSHTAVVNVGVNGEWSAWSAWSGCGSRCGIGEKRRLRTCSDPPPKNGGLACPGESIQTKTCTKLCPVNGGWTDWSSWSTCSPGCVHRRRRTCTRPRPHNNGLVCPGSDIEAKNCSNGLCSTNGIMGENQNVNYNQNIVLYSCLFVAIGILFFITIATVVILRKKRSSGQSGRSSRYAPGRRQYSSDSGGSIKKQQQDDFCFVQSKLPSVKDMYPPSYAFGSEHTADLNGTLRSFPGYHFGSKSSGSQYYKIPLHSDTLSQSQHCDSNNVYQQLAQIHINKQAVPIDSRSSFIEHKSSSHCLNNNPTTGTLPIIPPRRVALPPPGLQNFGYDRGFQSHFLPFPSGDGKATEMCSNIVHLPPEYDSGFEGDSNSSSKVPLVDQRSSPQEFILNPHHAGEFKLPDHIPTLLEEQSPDSTTRKES